MAFTRARTLGNLRTSVMSLSASTLRLSWSTESMAKVQEKRTNPKQPKFPLERDYALHLRWSFLGWTTHSSTSTSFRICHMAQQSLMMCIVSSQWKLPKKMAIGSTRLAATQWPLSTTSKSPQDSNTSTTYNLHSRDTKRNVAHSFGEIHTFVRILNSGFNLNRLTRVYEQQHQTLNNSNFPPT